MDILNMCTTESVSCCILLHVYPDLVFVPSFQSDGFLKDNNNAAQRLLDGVKYISQSVSELSVKPAKAITSWLTDQIAPTYWKPNSLILVHNKHCCQTRSKTKSMTAIILCLQPCSQRVINMEQTQRCRVYAAIN